MSEGKRKAGRQAPWEGSVEHEAGEFGQWLRREREVREVTLEEISDVTKISKAYLHALEQERFDVLPAPVFAKGFLREYAKYVGLDPDEVVNSYLTAMSDDEPDVPGGDVSSEGRSSFEWTLGILLAAGLLVLVGAIGFAGFWAERAQRDDSSDGAEPTGAAPAPPRPAPAVQTAPGAGSAEDGALDDRTGEAVSETEESTGTAAAVPDRATGAPSGEGAGTVAAPTGPLVVTIDFTEDCWVEASVDGRRRLSELHVQGESLHIDAERRVELTLGNPAGVVVEVNGEPFALPDYRPGRVARDIVIDLEEVG